MVAFANNRAPGVHLQVVSNAPTPALETGVPVFVGPRMANPPAQLANLATALGIGKGFTPPWAPVLLDFALWMNLDNAFGTSWAEGVFGPAVSGFFTNGGKRCYVLFHEPAEFGAALAKLESLDDFDVLCAPNAAGDTAAHTAILDFCQRRPGCFALLDGPGSRVPNPALNAGTFITCAESTKVVGASGQRIAEEKHFNAALYGPWLKVRGGCPSCSGSGCVICADTGYGFVPPSGHIAGLLSRLDREIGVFRAPANQELKGVLDVQVAFSEASLSSLNTAGVIPIRALAGRGIRPWGARTLAPTDVNFSHINVRRTYLTILRWLQFAGAELAFEPNDFRLWLRVQREVTAFLEQLRAGGAFLGTTAEEAYYVKCNEETNPPAVRNAGMMVAEIGVSIAKPNEFIIVRLETGSGNVTVSR